MLHLSVKRAGLTAESEVWCADTANVVSVFNTCLTSDKNFRYKDVSNDLPTLRYTVHYCQVTDVCYENCGGRLQQLARQTYQLDATIKLIEWDEVIVTTSNFIGITAPSRVRSSVWNKTTSVMFVRLTRLKYMQCSWPFDVHCCHISTAMKHPVSDRLKPSFIIFDIRALWRSGLSVRVPGCQKLQMTA